MQSLQYSTYKTDCHTSSAELSKHKYLNKKS